MLNAVKGKQENSQLNKKVLEKLYFFYKGRVQKTKNREKQQHKKNNKKNTNQTNLCLFSAITVSQYLCYTTKCYCKISQHAHY